jgi:hypothetical protein
MLDFARDFHGVAHYIARAMYDTFEKPSNLRKFDDQWGKTPARAPEDRYAGLPDGDYEAIIEEARLSETASTQRPIVIWTLRIEGPHGAGRVVHTNRVITDKTLSWLKEDLEKCGLSLDRISELEARLPELNGRPVMFRKITKPTGSDIYFSWSRPKAAPEADSDLPF